LQSGGAAMRQRTPIGRSLIFFVTALAVAIFPRPLLAAWQPTRPVEFVIPAGTGGGADLMARFVAAIIQKENLAPQTFLAVNKSGGAGAEAFLYMKEQKGNPHVIVITLSNLFTTPLHTGVPFNCAGEVCTNLVGKHVDSTVNNPSECVGNWKANRVRPLAVLDSGHINLPDWDKIPTIKEATGKDVSYMMLRGIFTAPGAPKE